MRAAMVGGGAYVAGRHAQGRKQQESDQEARIEQLENQPQAAPAAAPAAAAAPAPAAGPAPVVDVAGQLTQLKSLLDAGVLTQAEFDGQKQKLLQGA
ncbi:SHOCT domain-containing protein [Conexibacter sp. CPCC 206217]|uniref:SHOCT domain-containing protein n=1 Tax=Conexibacter sp. CPCC 206217 TaxID=3064574 RepID=UPI00271BC633|nr:SHOCT domain-containing protein [Conexibacter sp. CPCC 206217]MDO8214205.1 SHOCT domain-containing protein [Conexibacter sp. CPCC 206217]